MQSVLPTDFLCSGQMIVEISIKTEENIAKLPIFFYVVVKFNS
jgi:hypothetical protein